LHDLLSGRDQETTAPPQAKEEGPEAAPKPQPELEPEKAEAPVAVPPKAKPSQPTSPKTKEATRETAPKPLKEGSVDRAVGDSEREGDPYLNLLWTQIERHRFYPTGAVGSFGLNLEGTVVYLIALSPGGAIEGMRLERSSGAPQLDDTARKMIEQAAPFPPLPNYFPRGGVTLSVTIHLFPTAS
jgi:protein TonB